MTAIVYHTKCINQQSRVPIDDTGILVVLLQKIPTHSNARKSVWQQIDYYITFASDCSLERRNGMGNYREELIRHLICSIVPQIAKFMGTTWDPPGSCRPQMGPMLAPWNLLSGYFSRYGSRHMKSGR